MSINPLTNGDDLLLEFPNTLDTWLSIADFIDDNETNA